MYLESVSLKKLHLSSARELIRKKGLVTHVSKNCWHKNLPLKNSIFLWKLLNNATPSDWAISKKGIYLLSKCV